MSVIAPRGAALPTPTPTPSAPSASPASPTSPLAVDRAPVEGQRDFETVLRERGGQRRTPPQAATGGRGHRADASEGGKADRPAAAPTAATGSATPTSQQPAVDALNPVATDASPGVEAAVTPAVLVTIPTTAGSAVVVPAAAAPSVGDVPTSSSSAPASSNPTTSSSSSAPGTAAGHGLVDSAEPAPGAAVPVHLASPVRHLAVEPGVQDAGGQAQSGVVAAPTGPATPNPASPLGGSDPGGDATHDHAVAGPATTADADPATGAAYPMTTIQGTAQVGVGAPVAVPTDGRPAQPTLPPQAQVLNAVAPLVTTADGTHRLTVHLAPAHLGSVQVHIEVTGGAVTVRLTAADPATGDALRQGSAELRSHLERIGLRSSGIEVQVATGDAARDAAGRALTGSATTDGGDRGSGQRDPGPWAGSGTPDGRRDAPGDGAWQRHEQPLEGWSARDPGTRRSRGAPPAAPHPDPLRPPLHDVRVDVRM